ncbi:MAG: hypothetical protein AAGA85_12990 [Bacteroidota bacterium]
MGYEIITMTTYLLFVYLLVALFVERLIEIFMALFHYIDNRRGGFQYWNKKAHQWRKRLDRIYDYQGNQPRAKTLLDWLMWKVLIQKPYPGGKSAISAKGVKFMFIRVGTRITALVISLILVISIHRYLQIDLLEVLLQVAAPEDSGTEAVGLLSNNHVELVRAVPTWLRLTLSAMVISAGVEPLHELITRIEDLGKPNRPLGAKP